MSGSTPEGRVKRKVTELIKSFGDKIWYFMPVQSGYGKPALDYICCVNGYFVSIETKKDDKSPLRPTQIVTREFMQRANGRVFVVYDEHTLVVLRDELCKLCL